MKDYRFDVLFKNGKELTIKGTGSEEEVQRLRETIVSVYTEGYMGVIKIDTFYVNVMETAYVNIVELN